MKWASFAAFLACLALSLACLYSQDAQAQVEEEPQELRILSSSIKDRLLSLKQESLYMKEQLETLSKSLETSQAEQAALTERLMSSSASLTSISDELASCYDSIERLESKVKARGRVVLILGIVFGVMILAKIAGYILYAYGIKVPRWLDILL